MSIFSKIRAGNPKYHGFDLSHTNKLTCEMGLLIPTLSEPVLPGDKLRLSSSYFMRFQPMIAPMLSEVNLYSYNFFVPNRLLNKNFRKFITQGVDGKQTSVYNCVPAHLLHEALDVAFGGHGKGYVAVQSGSLWDYLGYPTMTAQFFDEDFARMDDQEIDLSPIFAYNLVYDSYFIDLNLQKSLIARWNLVVDNLEYDHSVFIVDDEDYSTLFKNVIRGILDPSSLYFDILTYIFPDSSSLLARIFKLRQKAWKKDYFTSALPWPQRGEDVELPLQMDLSIGSNPADPSFDFSVTVDKGRFASNQPQTGNHELGLAYGGSSVLHGNISDISNSSSSQRVVLEGYGNSPASEVAKSLKINGQNSIANTTINEFRRALAAQKFFETRARGGSRYIEQMLSFFGVRSSDARLQRPEFLGGAKQPVVVSDILQSSSSDSTSPQGNPAGVGISVGSQSGRSAYFEEHGWIIQVFCIIPNADYFQGMPRKYQKSDPLDYYWPQFAHLGEQEIKVKELYWQGNREEVFGYAPRYAEYKYCPNTIHGAFRDSLKFWTLAREFDSSPRLNGSFIECQPSDRIFAVQSDGTNATDHCLVSIRHNLKALRKMPYFGTPGL